MKTILALLFCSIIFAQNNFIIENQELVWQKVTETNLSQEEIVSFLEKSGNFTNIKVNNNEFTAEFFNLGAEFKAAGYTEMGAPIYIARSYLSGFITIDFKENKYRSTIKNIKVTQRYTDALTRQGETHDLEIYALRRRNTEFKSMFIGKASEILDFTFQKITTVANTPSTDW